MYVIPFKYRVIQNTQDGRTHRSIFVDQDQQTFSVVKQDAVFTKDNQGRTDLNSIQISSEVASYSFTLKQAKANARSMFLEHVKDGWIDAALYV